MSPEGIALIHDSVPRAEYDRVVKERDELRSELPAIGAPVVSKEMYDRVCAEVKIRCEAIEVLVRQRDEARAELERLRREPPTGLPSHEGCVSCHPTEGT
jgi:hypothetical protein